MMPKTTLSEPQGLRVQSRPAQSWGFGVSEEITSDRSHALMRVLYGILSSPGPFPIAWSASYLFLTAPKSQDRSVPSDSSRHPFTLSMCRLCRRDLQGSWLRVTGIGGPSSITAPSPRYRVTAPSRRYLPHQLPPTP
ncbi:hypothetical protein SO802_005059 [Lithocarpus litseifolius]|uniref:Uncharacterized protein n=1 Tax=Lithocarpus litseifolius TaxID=425828 RepID=A0AAW2DMP3_9ROSI